MGQTKCNAMILSEMEKEYNMDKLFEELCKTFDRKEVAGMFFMVAMYMMPDKERKNVLKVLKNEEFKFE